MRSSLPHGSDIWEALEGLRDTIAAGGGWRSDAVDVRTAILVSLIDQPAHGYAIIQAIEARTGWKPSPGEVYPELQLLSDEQLVTAELVGERKVYTLTDAGREIATSASTPDDAGESSRARIERNLVLPKAGAKLAQAAALVGQSGTPEQTERAVEILDEARRKLFAILAED